MAKSTTLVASLAGALGRRPESVKVALRRLHEAGLIKVGGKGYAGKEMTSADAALLLLATTGGGTLKDAPETAEAYAGLPPIVVPRRSGPFVTSERMRDRLREPLLKKAVFDRLFFHSIPAYANFGSVLEQVIQRAVEGTLFPEIGPDDFATAPPQEPCDRVLNVRLYGPEKAASIDVGMNQRQFWRRLIFGNEEVLQAARYGTALASDSSDRFLEIRQIPLPAIERIAQSLR